MQPTRPERRPELDALRGLFLVWMTLTHLPTHFSDLMNNPFGFFHRRRGSSLFRRCWWAGLRFAKRTRMRPESASACGSVHSKSTAITC
ncbi:hypothetical protein SBA5_220059 [Candidatus Sulfotelmatomonas gaucii]|uniref:Uncharacterized protein n=1 Tax=Candidatus Sulfuritelmatomonas gaucii TaxID=2043161 RepID=A0A2N9L7W5_9BACT|nr:hypothetical protein SBA5_220059 [Candidatus Sulfotelmatomonas gaucii]